LDASKRDNPASVGGSEETTRVLEEELRMAANCNLLFIMTDHQRADSMGMVQAGLEVTPNLNRLAAQGSVFARAYSTCPLCVPARTALATGKYPTRNGVVVNDWQGASARDHKPLHQYLFEAGYDVGHVGVHHIRVKPSLEERIRFSRWVDNAEYSAYCARCGIHETKHDTSPFSKQVVENQEGRPTEEPYSNTRTGVWPHACEHFRDFYWCREAVSFVEQKRSRPFALFVYLWAPHPPLLVPELYASLFDPSRLRLPDNLGQPAKGEPHNRRCGVPAQLADGVTADEWKKVWSAHLGLVNLADTGIGHILDALNASRHAGNTFIVFTVDHGDHLGQHAMYQKMEMYEQALRVPLIIQGPEIRRQVSDEPVSHLDVMPTILDCLEIETPKDLDGDSLLPSLQTGAPVPERPAFAQYSGNPRLGDVRRCIITRRYKYTFDPSDTPELYDLETDPLEMNNIAPQPRHARLIHELHEQCKAWGLDNSDWAFGPAGASINEIAERLRQTARKATKSRKRFMD